MTFGLPIWGLPFLPNDTEYSKKMVFVWRLIISHVIRHCKFYCRVQHFSGKNSATNWNKEPDEEKIYRSTEFFLKLDNNGWEMHTGARARKQKYLCIYISLYMKTFLKTGVYTYNIYISVWICKNMATEISVIYPMTEPRSGTCFFFLFIVSFY